MTHGENLANAGEHAAQWILAIGCHFAQSAVIILPKPSYLTGEHQRGVGIRRFDDVDVLPRHELLLMAVLPLVVDDDVRCKPGHDVFVESIDCTVPEDFTAVGP